MLPLCDESHCSKKFPIITIGLIFLNTIIFLFTWSCLNLTIEKFGMVPQNILYGNELQTIFTSMFLHGGWLHLLGNMWFLWIFGDNLESVLGRGRFLFFYIFCGAIAGFIYCFLTSDINIPTIGASGAISGVLGGYLLLYPKNKIRTLVPFGFFFTTVSVPAVIFLIFWLLYQFFLPLEGVAVGAHIVGFLAGALLVKFFEKK